MDRKRIIIVDDSPTSLKMCAVILRPHYAVAPLPSADRMFQVLERFTPDLIILDIEMPGVDGYEALRRLKVNAALRDIPVALLTSHIDYDSERRGRSMGAVDYLRKPVSAQSLLRRVGAIFDGDDEDATGEKILNDIQAIRGLLKEGSGADDV